MNWNHIVTVYLKELKDSLRDRRTLISMIVVPALVMPVIMIGVGLIMSKIVRQAKQPKVGAALGKSALEVAITITDQIRKKG